MTITPCGCILELHTTTGARRNVHRCDEHKAAANPHPGREYYEQLGTIAGNTSHVAEFRDAFGELPKVDWKNLSVCLEVGCGVSPYVQLVTDAGYAYTGMDASEWTTEFMLSRPGVQAMQCGRAEDMQARDDCDLILAAHVLEHVSDAQKVLANFFRALRIGGYLYLIIPDDEDLCNPDHNWFFTPESIVKTVTGTGFTVESVSVKRVVPHEQFIYLKARKLRPEPFPVSIPGLVGNAWMYRSELDKLVSLVGQRSRVLEIGSADGVTAGHIARLRPECVVVSIDPYTPYPEDNGFPGHEERLAHWRANATTNQSLWMGDVRSWQRECREKFDIVIIDGVHSYTDVFSDLVHGSTIVAIGGVIVAHDYDPEAFPQVAAAVDRFCEECGWEVSDRAMTLAILRRKV